MHGIQNTYTKIKKTSFFLAGVFASIFLFGGNSAYAAECRYYLDGAIVNGTTAQIQWDPQTKPNGQDVTLFELKFDPVGLTSAERSVGFNSSGWTENPSGVLVVNPGAANGIAFPSFGSTYVGWGFEAVKPGTISATMSVGNLQCPISVSIVDASSPVTPNPNSDPATPLELNILGINNGSANLENTNSKEVVLNWTGGPSNAVCTGTGNFLGDLPGSNSGPQQTGNISIPNWTGRTVISGTKVILDGDAFKLLGQTTYTFGLTCVGSSGVSTSVSRIISVKAHPIISAFGATYDGKRSEIGVVVPSNVADAGLSLEFFFNGKHSNSNDSSCVAKLIGGSGSRDWKRFLANGVEQKENMSFRVDPSTKEVSNNVEVTCTGSGLVSATKTFTIKICGSGQIKTESGGCVNSASSQQTDNAQSGVNTIIDNTSLTITGIEYNPNPFIVEKQGDTGLFPYKSKVMTDAIGDRYAFRLTGNVTGNPTSCKIKETSGPSCSGCGISFDQNTHVQESPELLSTDSSGKLVIKKDLEIYVNYAHPDGEQISNGTITIVCSKPGIADVRQERTIRWKSPTIFSPPQPTSVSGTCGMAAKTYASSANTTDGSLCSSGTADTVATTVPFDANNNAIWTCNGSETQFNADDARCTATRCAGNQTVLNGQCVCPSGQSVVNGVCQGSSNSGGSKPMLQLSVASGNGPFSSYELKQSPITVNKLTDYSQELTQAYANVKMAGSFPSPSANDRGQFFWRGANTNGVWNTFSPLNSTPSTQNEAIFPVNSSMNGYWRSEYSGSWDIVFCVFRLNASSKTENCSDAIRVNSVETVGRPGVCVDTPQDATLCRDDDKGLPGESALISTVVTSCTDKAKCEYICNSGFGQRGNTCVASSTPSYSCTTPNTCKFSCSGGESAVSGTCPVIGGDQAQRCCAPAPTTPSGSSQWCSVSTTQAPNATVTLNQCTNGCTLIVNKKNGDTTLVESLMKQCPNQINETFACSIENQVVTDIAGNRTYRCVNSGNTDSCSVAHVFAPNSETIQVECPYDSAEVTLPVITSFNAVSPVNLGSKTKFYWNADNATGCYISGNGKYYTNLPASHTSDASGVRESEALQSLGNIGFTLTCCNLGPGGNNACAPNVSGVAYSPGVTRNVSIVNTNSPNVTFTAASSSAPSGGDIVLHWDASTVSGASSCTISGNGKTVAGNLPRTGLASQGSMTITVPETLSAKKEVYTFSCMGISSKTLDVMINPSAPKIDSFTAISPINSGQKTTFKWETTNVIEKKCTVNVVGGTKEYRILDADNIVGLESDVLENTTSSDVTIAFRLSCSGAQGFSAATMEKNVIVHPKSVIIPSSPTITSFTADPTAVNSGGKTKFMWASQNATKCSIMGGGETYTNLASSSTGYESKSLTNATANELTVSFNLKCEGDSGTTPAESMIAVKVKAGVPYPWWDFWDGPQLNFYPSATSVYGEDGVQLNWYGKDLSGTCKASGSWLGTKTGSATIQSETIKPLRQTSSFTLECAGADGQIISKTVVVKLKSPKIVAFKATPKAVVKNEKTDMTFTWEAKGVQSCKGSKNWGAKRGLSGTEQKKNVTLSKKENYKFECVAFDGKKVGKTITVQAVDVKSLQSILLPLRNLFSL